MRKTLLLVMVVLLVLSGTVLAEVNLKLGMSFSGEHVLSYDDEEVDDWRVDNGITIAGEYLVPYSDNLDLGAGIAYQFPRGLENTSDDVEFNFVPVYGIARYNMEQSYLFGQLGYNFFEGSDEYDYGRDLDGGLYYGLGAGVNLTDNTFGEILFSVNNGSIEDSGDEAAYEMDVQNTQITMFFGYSF